MKLTNDNWLTLKNELNDIRNTCIAVAGNRYRPMTAEDIEIGVKAYQILGIAELPMLTSDKDEDINVFVNEFFNKVVFRNHDEPCTPEQQNLAIEALDEAAVDAVRKWDSRIKLDKQHYFNRQKKQQVFEWLDANWDGVNQTRVRKKLLNEKWISNQESTLKTWIHDYTIEHLNK